MSEINLYYISTKKMLVNIFTKQLFHRAFKKFYAYLGVILINNLISESVKV